MKMRAVGHRVLVKVTIPEENQKITNAGLIIADSYKDRNEMGTDTGTVEQIGSTADQVFLEGLKVGDTVVFSKYSGCAKNFDNCLYRILNDNDIWGIIENKE